MEKFILLIIDGIIGFFAPIAKDYFLEKTKRKNNELEIKIEKIEELFLIVSRTQENVFNQLVLQSINTSDGAKAGMLVRYYFPNIFSEYQFL
jgi:hypothetical protein